MEYHGDQVSEAEVNTLIQRVTGMALMYGVQRKVTDNEFPERQEAMPYTLFPSRMSTAVFQQARQLHPHFQTLMYKVANDHQFMKDCFKDIIPVDDFTRQFWNIYETVRNEGVVQPVALTLTRNDFMMEARSDDFQGQHVKQVEFNTFACGGGGEIGPMPDVHRYSLTLAGLGFDGKQLPRNRPTEGLAKGMVKAWELYSNNSAVLLFIVEVPEPSAPDQRWLERYIAELAPTVSVIYSTFDQLVNTMTLGENKELIVDGKEVAVVYYRCGYSPKHYPTPKEWNLRLQLERSSAIKCPTMAFHLAGCKKIQQVLAEDGVLERFLTDKTIIQEIRSTFVGLHRLEMGCPMIDVALNNPDKYVLKPQREGGGNNYFDEELRTYLGSIKNSPEISSWILMERIQGTIHRNRLIRVGLGPECRDVVSELGIFGVHISTADTEVENFECGYALKAKSREANEGGLVNGLSCLDSPMFTD